MPESVMEFFVSHGWWLGPLVMLLLFPGIGYLVMVTETETDNKVWNIVRGFLVRVLPFNEDGTPKAPLKEPKSGGKKTPKKQEQ